ncbi:hypothetical protein N9D31_04210, partial [Oligoflexaceae bacterium]|nr:hypothetical protein [Oligoflexaceae bacterium]
MNFFIKLWLSFTACFAICRFSYVDLFLGWQSEKLAADLASFGVGLLSDLWIAVLLATVLSISRWVLRRVLPKQAAHSLILLVTFVIIALNWGHISYFEFFQNSMAAHHFEYLIDPQFVGSNIASLTSYR